MPDHALPAAPIVVTGATGFVAAWVIRELLALGATVHGTARSPDDPEKVGYLHALADDLPGTLKLFRADLLDPAAFDAPLDGAAVVLHTASPFPLGAVADAQAELIQPALQGTRNVLEACNRTASVERVVVTSSIAAVHGEISECAARGGILTEAHWNTTSSETQQPYYYSKLLAEQEAWKIAEAQDRWRLVTVNPGFVMGPSLSKRSRSASIDWMRKMLDGTWQTAIIPQNTGFVDVRDVASAHVNAALLPDAEGRHILVSDVVSFFGAADLLRPAVGDRGRLPVRKVPKWLCYLILPMQGYSWRYITHNVEVPLAYDTQRSRERLGVTYRPVLETLTDMAEAMLADGL